MNNEKNFLMLPFIHMQGSTSIISEALFEIRKINAEIMEDYFKNSISTTKMQADMINMSSFVGIEAAKNQLSQMLSEGISTILGGAISIGFTLGALKTDYSANKEMNAPENSIKNMDKTIQELDKNLGDASSINNLDSNNTFKQEHQDDLLNSMKKATYSEKEFKDISLDKSYDDFELDAPNGKNGNDKITLEEAVQYLEDDSANQIYRKKEIKEFLTNKRKNLQFELKNLQRKSDNIRSLLMSGFSNAIGQLCQGFGKSFGGSYASKQSKFQTESQTANQGSNMASSIDQLLTSGISAHFKAALDAVQSYQTTISANAVRG